MGGQVVRLQQGKADARTVYSSDPVAMALSWQEQGGEYLHIVDLDGAFQGKPINLPIVQKIAQALKIPCELGGGMRDLETIGKAIEGGVSRVVIGSKACDSLDFVKQAVEKFGGDKIAIGIDAKDGVAAIKGWVEQSQWKAVDLAKAVVDLGVQTIIYTDISTDGMLKGPNLPAMREMQSAVNVQLVASGGVSSLEDIKNLSAIPGLYAAIVGKALYDKKFTLQECLSITH